jgi:hypothetical protein
MFNLNPTRTKYKVMAENLDALRDRVEEVNRRVRRLCKRGHAVEEVKISVGQLYAEAVSSTVEGGRQVSREQVYADVELLSPRPPRVDGWEFVAALIRVDDVGTVLRVCPGATVAEGELARYREASPDDCDHCHTRRRRTETFVVRDREGQLRQVGRQCLADYTGIEDPAALCAAAEVLFAVSEVLGAAEGDPDSFGGRGPRYASIAAYLPYVACSIRVDGWLSRTAAREKFDNAELSTASQAMSRGLFATPECRNKYEPEERDYSLAAATVEFCAEHFDGFDVSTLSDYENSLRVAMASGILHPKLVGIVASSISFYKRDVERRTRGEAWAKRVARSTFQGQVGERRVFEGLKVVACREWPGDFGPTYFYSFSDESDNAFAYFASRDLLLEVGQVVSLKGTVKKHEMRTPKLEGAVAYAQTVLSRCALVTRARVVSVSVVEKDLGKRVVTNSDEVRRGMYAQYACVLEKVNVYHLEAPDGRRFCYQSKAKKRQLVAGATAIVEYAAEDESAAVSRERPVSLVAVVEAPASAEQVALPGVA